MVGSFLRLWDLIPTWEEARGIRAKMLCGPIPQPALDMTRNQTCVFWGKEGSGSIICNDFLCGGGYGREGSMSR